MKITALKKLQKGFTLIELLVVIAVLGILAAAVLVAINPAAKIQSAKDVNVKNDLSQVVSALQAYYTVQSNPQYPATLNLLVSSNELKSLPKPVQQDSYACPAAPNGSQGTDTTYCYVVTATGDKSAIWGKLAGTATTPFYCWDSTSGAYKSSATAPTQASPVCP